MATGWTRPLHLATTAFFGLNGLITITVAIGTRDDTRRAAVRALAVANQARPDPLNVEQLRQAVDFAVTVGIGVSVLIGVLSLVLAGLALRDWAWVFYLCLVFAGLSAIPLATNLIGLAAGTAGGIQSALGLAVSAAGVALFAWLLAARFTRGVWARSPAQPGRGAAS